MLRMIEKRGIELALQSTGRSRHHCDDGWVFTIATLEDDGYQVHGWDSDNPVDNQSNVASSVKEVIALIAEHEN